MSVPFVGAKQTSSNRPLEFAAVEKEEIRRRAAPKNKLLAHDSKNPAGMSLKKRPLTKSPISFISEGSCVSVELKITRGYGKLLGLPEAANGARMVSLDRIANCEIRMFKTPETSTVEVPLFWIELVDLSTQSSLDSCRCYNVDEAVAVFEAFASQARCLNGSCPDSGTED